MLSIDNLFSKQLLNHVTHDESEHIHYAELCSLKALAHAVTSSDIIFQQDLCGPSQELRLIRYFSHFISCKL
jgi:hypothetical protein